MNMIINLTIGVILYVIITTIIHNIVIRYDKTYDSDGVLSTLLTYLWPFFIIGSPILGIIWLINKIFKEIDKQNENT